jgi:hypothetical protein
LPKSLGPLFERFFIFSGPRGTRQEKPSKLRYYAARRRAQGYSRFYATLGWRTRKIPDIFKQESSLSILWLRALEQELVQEY